MYAALLTWFIKPDDGPIGTETCSLPFIKYDVPDVNCCIILVIKLLAHRDVFNQTKHYTVVKSNLAPTAVGYVPTQSGVLASRLLHHNLPS
jgi:hypothetical protein